jgi:predicted transcriptional regulator
VTRLHDVPHRTTLTLDDDVAASLQLEARRSGRPYRAVVNDALRLGLERRVTVEREPFRVEARDLGLRPDLDLDDIEGLLDAIEGTSRR